MLERGIEVTVAHELIHLSDRVQGRPRKHRAMAATPSPFDEAAITGRDAETLRRELAEETRRREESLRQVFDPTNTSTIVLVPSHLSTCATLCAASVVRPLLSPVQSRLSAATYASRQMARMSIQDI